MVEMFEYLVVEEQHTILGVSPDALKKIFDLLRDKIVEVKAEYDEDCCVPVTETLIHLKRIS